MWGRPLLLFQQGGKDARAHLLQPPSTEGHAYIGEELQ